MTDIEMTYETGVGQNFAEQNPLAAAQIPSEAVDQWAEHHAGGLYVLGAECGNLYMKLHDSWGDEEDVIVHIYDSMGGGHDMVFHFTNGHSAIAFFEWAMEATFVETFEAER